MHGGGGGNVPNSPHFYLFHSVCVVCRGYHIQYDDLPLRRLLCLLLHKNNLFIVVRISAESQFCDHKSFHLFRIEQSARTLTGFRVPRRRKIKKPTLFSVRMNVIKLGCTSSILFVDESRKNTHKLQAESYSLLSRQQHANKTTQQPQQHSSSRRRRPLAVWAQKTRNNRSNNVRGQQARTAWRCCFFNRVCALQ